MGKLLDFAAAALLVVLLWALQYVPHSPLFWVASTTPAFIALRSLLVFVLVWFMIYTPESKRIRTPMGLITALFSVWLLAASFNGSVQILDSISLLMASVALMLSLLETKPKEELFRSVQLLHTASRRVAVEFKPISVRALRLSWRILTDIDMALENYYRRMGAVEHNPDANPRHRHA